MFLKTFLMMLNQWYDTSNYDENDKRPLPL